MRLARMASAAAALLFCIFWATPVHAACSGSGTTWSCTAGSAVSDVQSAVNSATNGAVITLANGSYNWSSSVNFSTSKGVTIICATVRGCNITTSSQIFTINTWSGTIPYLYRISGFVVTNSADFTIWFGSGGGVNGTLSQVRIDNNTFNARDGGHVIVIGENTSVAQAFGVIDHNIFTSSGSVEGLYMLGLTNPTPITGRLGSANNMFFEDNTITSTTMTNGGLGAVDGWGAGFSMVFRHNTVTNALVTSHGATHGGGPPNWELYNNTLIANSGSQYPDGYRLFHHQGSGTIVAFNNVFTASSSKNDTAISVIDYRAFPNSIDGGAPTCDGTYSKPFADGKTDGNRSPTTTYRGYACWHQPGRDFAGTLVPMYVWNNYWSDTHGQVPLVFESGFASPDYTTNHEQANRDYFNAVSASANSSPTAPFNGSTGMGFGTLANRPTTCSPAGTDAADAGHGGVGYFATDQGAQGTLYTCTSTNTWTPLYTPYTYPHPLVTGGGGSSGAPPLPPTTLTSIVR